MVAQIVKPAIMIQMPQTMMGLVNMMLAQGVWTHQHVTMTLTQLFLRLAHTRVVQVGVLVTTICLQDVMMVLVAMKIALN